MPEKRTGKSQSSSSKRSRKDGLASSRFFIPVVVVIAILAVVGSVMLSSGDETPSAGPSAASLAPGEVTASPRTPICENLSPPLLNIKTVRSTPYPMTIDKNATYTAEMTTSCGTMLIKLYAKQAPIAVNNFVNLAEDHFYTGLVFHRLDRNLGIIQAGDPGCPTSVNTCGTGGPGYTIKDEFGTGLKPALGTVAMASAGTPNSSGSQFEIVASSSGPELPRQRTIFGHLIGQHSYQVAKVILSIPTKIAPDAPPSAPKDYPDGEFVYITSIKITKSS